MTVGGDVMLGRRVATASARAGDVSRPLRAIGPRLAAADIAVVNLESTLSRAGSPQQGGDSFAAPPGVLAGLRSAGVDVLSLANNHTGDFGAQALVRTVDRVRAAGIPPLGAGRNAAEARLPVVVNRAGLRFGFLAFNAIGETPRAATGPGVLSVRMPPRTGPLNQADLAVLTRAVTALRQTVDVVVVLPHWGQQYTHKPVPAQRVVANALLRAGADLVVGGHPHWVQGVDVRGSKLIAHSLGNLVFDMDFSRPTQEGVLLELTYWGKTLKAARLTPYVIGADFAPRLVAGARAERILAAIRSTSTVG
ncbi:MAG TPA: CapA family protein [Kribbella sp.]|nr:CapA family protein [Kribbella sp.]